MSHRSPGRLTGVSGASGVASASGRIRVLREPAEWRNGLISRADVAAYLIDAVEQGLDVRRDVVLAR